MSAHREQTGRGNDAAEIFDNHGRAVEQSRRLVEASRLHSGGIAAELSAVRASLAVSRTLLAAGTAARDKAVGSITTQRTFAAVTELVEQIERGAAQNSESIDRLIAQIKASLRTEANLDLLIGVLVEGIAQAIRRLAPGQERRDMLAAVVAMLHGRSNPDADWPT